MTNDIAISIKDLRVDFDVNGKVLKALRGVSLDIYAGECLVIVGESGSGKSVFCKSCMGLLDDNGRYQAGEIRYREQDLVQFQNQRQWQEARKGNLGMIMQNPQASLNPLRTIGSQIMESFLLHGGMSRKTAKEHTLAMLADAGFLNPERAFKQFPHELSGGMCQRAAIAMSVAARPKILFLDEPTSSLDVMRQAQILEYINRLRRKYKLTLVFVTHDFGVAARMADRIAVMYAGEIVEIGTAQEIFFDPRHPYTWSLLSSLPQLSNHAHVWLEGTAPDLTKPVIGDAFAPRNPWALQIDFLQAPPYFEVSPTHKAKTWLLSPHAPSIEPPVVVRQLKILTEQLVNRWKEEQGNAES